MSQFKILMNFFEQGGNETICKMQNVQLFISVCSNEAK